MGCHALLQVIGVVQTESASLVCELVRREALQRSLRGHGHEDGEGHRAVGQMESRRACPRHLQPSDWPLCDH